MALTLDADFDSKTFYESIRPDFTQWSHLIPILTKPYGLEVLQSRAFSDGVNLVACINETHVLKILPPFHRHQWESERRSLKRLQSCLTLPIPEFLGAGEIENGWAYLLMSRVEGESLEEVWKHLSHGNKKQIMHAVGKVMAEVHALPVDELADLKPEWTAPPAQITGMDGGRNRSLAGQGIFLHTSGPEVCGLDWRIYPVQSPCKPSGGKQ